VISPAKVPMPNDAYYATFPLRIGDISSVNVIRQQGPLRVRMKIVGFGFAWLVDPV
jgi:hypothetical protein